MTVTIYENSSIACLARVIDAAAAPITQASIQSISVKVFTEDGVEITPAPEVEVGDVVCDTLQTDDRWTVDGTGYNLAIPLGGAAFPTQGNYQIEAHITPTDGLSFYVVWNVQAQNIYSE